MPQKYKVAICRRQALYDRLDLGPPFCTLVVLFGRRPRALYLYLITAIGILCLEALGIYGIPPHVVDGGVVGYSVKPRREFIFRAVFAERIVNLDKDFLGNVE